jgi:hypothetical protein
MAITINAITAHMGGKHSFQKGGNMKKREDMRIKD